MQGHFGECEFLMRSRVRRIISPICLHVAYPPWNVLKHADRHPDSELHHMYKLRVSWHAAGSSWRRCLQGGHAFQPTPVQRAILCVYQDPAAVFGGAQGTSHFTVVPCTNISQNFATFRINVGAECAAFLPNVTPALYKEILSLQSTNVSYTPWNFGADALLF